MMESQVISQNLLDLIGDRRVTAAVFTTFTFDPDFFELEVIPLLLNSAIAYSSDDRVKRFTVRENLREANLPIDVYYDLPMYRANGSVSPEMEYCCHGVHHPGGAFHGKVNLILLQDDEGGESLLLGAGSNNLTKAGWWDNIECQHWVELRPRTFGVRFKNILLEDIDLLETHRHLKESKSESAIGRIRTYLETTRASHEASAIHYFGLSTALRRRKFLDYILKPTRPISNYDNWHLEIISPFFADDAFRNEHEVFLKHGVQDITLLLPKDEEDRALCLEEYFLEVEKNDGIRWGEWSESVSNSLGILGGVYRPLHAKVYHFYNQYESWAFVGSVNFTHKALYDNIEAGFLVQLPSCAPLLQPLPDKSGVAQFAVISEEVPGSKEVESALDSMPEIHLSYDWVDKTLAGRVVADQDVEIEIVGPEGAPVTAPWLLSNAISDYPGEVSKLEDALKHGSLLKVHGYWHGIDGKTPFPEYRVLLQQLGWTHKPLEIPDLSAEQILSIYAGMTPERRQLLLVNAKIRELILSAQAGELTYDNEDNVVDQFFSEYAEIFNAFRQLRKRLKKALHEGRESDLDYYLTGMGIDSLPTLIQKASFFEESDEIKGLSGVSAYLLLLCCEEIFRIPDFIIRPQVQQKHESVCQAIKELEEGDRIALDNDSYEKREAFFGWFKEQFFKEYKPVDEVMS